MKTVNSVENSLAKILYQKVFSYFQNEENSRAFRKWYKKTYGKDYEEKRGLNGNARSKI